MEVHPPHEPIHSVRDFFLHIFTITVGLLIALALESGAEALHHRHLLHQAEENLHAEMRQNRTVLQKDEEQLKAGMRQAGDNLRLLEAARTHTGTAGELTFRWYWDAMRSSAWTTARDTGALSYMTYENAQDFSTLYGQQDIVNRQAEVYIDGIYRAAAPLQGGRKLADLSPAELDRLIANTQQTLADINHTTDLCRSLDHIYAYAETHM